MSCPEAGSCAAVGAYYTTLQDQLHGRPMVLDETAGGWEPAIVIAPAGSGEQVTLEGVSCAAVGTCVAVGVEGSIGLGATEPIAVAETEGHWGPAVDVIPPGGSTHSLLVGVSCPTAGTCVAVGGDEFGPFTITDSDGSWGTAEQVTMPASLTGPNFELPTVDLTGVSCAAVGTCVAIGEGWEASGPNQSAIGVTETEGHWGQAVVIAPPSPSPAAGNARTILQGVSCAAGSCLAVGDNEGPGPFAAVNTGGSWGPSSAIPPPGGAANGLLFGVSCPVGACIAVGEAEIGGKGVPAVIAESAGAWTEVAVEPPAAASFSDLANVSCPSAESCVAVGVADIAGDEEVPLVYGGGAPATVSVTTIDSPAVDVVTLTSPGGGGGGAARTCALALKGSTITVAKAHVADTGNGACDGNVSLAVPVKAQGKTARSKSKSAKGRKIGSASLRLAPGRAATILVPLNGAGEAALANAAGSLKASLAIRAGTAQITKCVYLNAPKTNRSRS